MASTPHEKYMSTLCSPGTKLLYKDESQKSREVKYPRFCNKVCPILVRCITSKWEGCLVRTEVVQLLRKHWNSSSKGYIWRYHIWLSNPAPRCTPKRIKDLSPQGNLCRNVHSGIIHNISKVQVTQTSITWQKDEQNVVCPHNGTTFSHRGRQIDWYR